MVARPTPPDPAQAAVYVISVAAELTGLHPQTLRSYERLGLITPGRTGGRGRRYSPRDIDLLREIAALTAAGIGIEGVRRILDLEHQVTALQQRSYELAAELDGAREALRQAISRSPRPVGSPAGSPAGRADSLPNKLPVLRPQVPEQSIVVWRRGR